MPPENSYVIMDTHGETDGPGNPDGAGVATGLGYR